MVFRNFKIVGLSLCFSLSLGQPAVAGPDDDAMAKKAFEAYVQKIETQAERYLVLIADHLVLDPSQLRPAYASRTPGGECAAGCGVLSGCAGISVLTPMLLYGMCWAPAFIPQLSTGLFIAWRVYSLAAKTFSPPPDPFLPPFQKISAMATKVRTPELVTWLQSHFPVFYAVLKERLLAKRSEFEILVASSGDYYSTSEERLRDVAITYLQLWLLAAIYEIEVDQLKVAEGLATVEQKLQYGFSVSQNSSAAAKCRAEILRLAEAPQ